MIVIIILNEIHKFINKEIYYKTSNFKVNKKIIKQTKMQ